MTEIHAHRGARAIAPENTLPAFEAALDAGAAGIELDVQCSQDGALVLMHDFTVERTTNGSGKVADLTLAELRQLDAGSYFDPSYAGVRVPTLEEVLDLVGDRCKVNVEIKTADFRGGDEVDALAHIIAERNLYDQLIVSSFNPITLIKMRHVDADVRLGLIYAQEPPIYLLEVWLGSLMNPDALHVHHALVDETFVARAHALGKAVNVWTVNEAEEARRVIDLGADVITTDVPGDIIADLASRPESPA